ncbi:MAG: trigger factor [Lachnospiraceae bacterium]|nr:trigger factor [Lachnospiraceae bacterium]
MKKRNYILAAAVLAFAVILTGCGDKNDKKEESTGKETDDVLAFDVKDYVELGEYKGLDVTYPLPDEVTDDAVKEAIQDTLYENTESKEVDRASQENDVVNIDYTGTMEGEEFEGGSDTDCDLKIGSGEFLPEFEENLIGKKAGETTVFSLTFPDDYDESLAGLAAEFTVKVNSVSEEIEPEYNVDFVKRVSDYETIEDYEASVKEELTKNAQDESDTEAEDHALRIVAENSKVDGYPQKLYDFFYDDNVAGYKAFAEMQGMEYEEFLQTFMSEEDIKEVVQEQVNDFLLSKAIMEKEGIEITDEEYAEATEEYAKENMFESAEDYEKEYGKTYIMTQMIRDKAVAFLRESANLQGMSWDEYIGEEDEEVYEEDLEEDEIDEEE